ncbi:hypothetical protein BJX96DRAFT_151309 [Aspergillus floccosus]
MRLITGVTGILLSMSWIGTSLIPCGKGKRNEKKKASSGIQLKTTTYMFQFRVHAGHRDRNEGTYLPIGSRYRFRRWQCGVPMSSLALVQPL